MSGIARDFWTSPEKREDIKAELASVKQGMSNPCIAQFGAGPAEKYCGGCSHLRRIHYSKAYLKCDQRTDLTHGAKTDQKAHWPACAKFEQVEAK